MKSGKPTYVLGTGLSHDGAACLIKDGEICVAIEKERITRRKHDGKNDNEAILYCLGSEGIRIDDVDLIVQCGNPWCSAGNDLVMNVGSYGERIVKDPHHGVPVVTISHHLAHAYNAVGTAPFDNMSIFVLDGSGQALKDCMDLQGITLPDPVPSYLSHLFLEKDSFYSYENGIFSSLYKDFSCYSEMVVNNVDIPMFPTWVKNSIGDAYDQAGAYCFGRGFSSAGKLMGLAPYGKPGIYAQEIFECRDGRVFTRYGWQERFNRPFQSMANFKRNFQYYADIAYWFQKETERAVLYLINERAKLTNLSNLAYTGGVALNAVINGKILDNTPFRKLYVTPAAGDNGLSIGCAFYGWLKVLKKGRKMHDGNSCFGITYSDAYIQNAIDNYMKLVSTDVVNAVNLLFEVLPKHLSREEEVKNGCTILIIVRDCGMFTIEFIEQDWHVRKGTVSNPDGTIIMSGEKLIQLMLGFQSVVASFKPGDVVLEGKAEDFVRYIDFGAMRSSTLDIIAKVGGDILKPLYTEEKDIYATAAWLLSQGKVIAWFQGGSEFGPRALGHRSIIADPRRKDIKDHINATIKYREDFRPLAPSVLLEDASEYFHLEGESPYMVLVANVKPQWKDVIPGVVHEDNSCRIQTVTPDWNPRYYSLLKQFKEISGIGVLLNTSLNGRNIPIIETPDQALDFFYNCNLDYLIMNNHIIFKDENDPYLDIPAKAGASYEGRNFIRNDKNIVN